MSDTIYRYENGERIECTSEEVEEFKSRQEIAASEAVEIKKVRKRNTRNALLADSDWTQANDSPLTDEAKASWVTYRTALRDLPSSSDWPDVTFPTEPS
mgnify:CR=1 FL=1